MKILHIDSSVLGEHSASRQLTADVVAELKRQQPAATVTYRDLATNPIAHLNGEILQAVRPAPGAHIRAELRPEADLTETLIQEFLSANVVVIGAPMYNFSIPSQLKAWLDRLAQPGRTFSYTSAGPVGLAGDKRVIVVSTRGGALKDTASELALDHQEAYLQTMLQFFGVNDVHYVRAEGLALGDDARRQALDSASQQIDHLNVAATEQAA